MLSKAASTSGPTAYLLSSGGGGSYSTFMFIWFTPESPYWLVRKDREGDAVRVFTKLSGRSDNEQDAGNRVLLIRETNRIEKELS